jgi:hypothetical protein
LPEYFVGRQSSDRAKDIQFAIPQRAFVETLQRFHGDQREELE